MFEVLGYLGILGFEPCRISNNGSGHLGPQDASKHVGRSKRIVFAPDLPGHADPRLPSFLHLGSFGVRRLDLADGFRRFIGAGREGRGREPK